jgi:hypothetical protein
MLIAPGSKAHTLSKSNVRAAFAAFTSNFDPPHVAARRDCEAGVSVAPPAARIPGAAPRLRLLRAQAFTGIMTPWRTPL